MTTPGLVSRKRELAALSGFIQYSVLPIVCTGDEGTGRTTTVAAALDGRKYMLVDAAECKSSIDLLQDVCDRIQLQMYSGTTASSLSIDRVSATTKIRFRSDALEVFNSMNDTVYVVIKHAEVLAQMDVSIIRFCSMLPTMNAARHVRLIMICTSRTSLTQSRAGQCDISSSVHYVHFASYRVDDLLEIMMTEKPEAISSAVWKRIIVLIQRSNVWLCDSVSRFRGVVFSMLPTLMETISPTSATDQEVAAAIRKCIDPILRRPWWYAQDSAADKEESEEEARFRFEQESATMPTIMRYTAVAAYLCGHNPQSKDIRLFSHDKRRLQKGIGKGKRPVLVTFDIERLASVAHTLLRNSDDYDDNSIMTGSLLECVSRLCSLGYLLKTTKTDILNNSSNRYICTLEYMRVYALGRSINLNIDLYLYNG